MVAVSLHHRKARPARLFWDDSVGGETVRRRFSALVGLLMLAAISTTKTGPIWDSRRIRQQVELLKFALSLEARFNPYRDSAGFTIDMRWQRKLKSDSSD